MCLKFTHGSISLNGQMSHGGMLESLSTPRGGRPPGADLTGLIAPTGKGQTPSGFKGPADPGRALLLGSLSQVKTHRTTVLTQRHWVKASDPAL